jgi:hypothetical protein
LGKLTSYELYEVIVPSQKKKVIVPGNSLYPNDDHLEKKNVICGQPIGGATHPL